MRVSWRAALWLRQRRLSRWWMKVFAPHFALWRPMPPRGAGFLINAGTTRVWRVWLTTQTGCWPRSILVDVPGASALGSSQ